MASVSLITTAYRASQADTHTLPVDADVATDSVIAEERGAYRVNGANGATPAPARSYTTFYNDCLEIAYGEFGLAATRCLLFLVRQIDGYHRDTAALSLTDFCDGMPRRGGGRERGTNLSRPSVMAGLSCFRISAWPSKGTVSTRMSAAAQAALFSIPETLACGPAFC